MKPAIDVDQLVSVGPEEPATLPESHSVGRMHDGTLELQQKKDALRLVALYLLCSTLIEEIFLLVCCYLKLCTQLLCSYSFFIIIETKLGLQFFFVVNPPL